MGTQDDPKRRRPAEEEPDFARGLAETDPDKHGRFSTGEEQLPDSAEKEHEGRFSEGEEQLPDSPEKEHKGRFSEGSERDSTSE